MRETYQLLAFESTHAAMAAERALKTRMPVTVMPTLRQITVACGIVWLAAISAKMIVPKKA